VANGPQPTAESIKAEIQRLDDELDTAMHLFADYEAILNQELNNTSDPAERSKIIERRTAYEDTLGIAILVDRIDALRAELRALQSR
jgi:hypothetical protein